MLTEILGLLFPQTVSTATILTEDGVEVVNLDDFDGDALMQQFPDGRIELVGDDDLVYAVATNQLPSSGAALKIEAEDGAKAYVYLLEPPVPVDAVPAEWDIDIPMPGLAIYTVVGSAVYAMEDLTNFQEQAALLPPAD